MVIHNLQEVVIIANEYKARVTATLVSGSLQKAIENEAKNAKITLQNVQVDTSKLISAIQTALNNHNFKINVNGLQQAGQQAGRQFVAGVNSQLKNIGVGIGGLNHVKTMLQNWGIVNPKEVELITQQLSQMSIAITKIKTDMAANGNIRMTITGVDELGRTVTQIKEFNRETGKISNAGRTISQTFGSVTTASQAAAEALKKQKQQAKELADAIKKAQKEALTLTRSSTLSNNIQAWMNKNTKAAQVFERELKDIQSRLNSNTNSNMLQRCAAEFQNIQAKAKAANLTVRGFQDTFVNLGNKVGNFALQMVGLGSAYQIGMKVINTIREGITTVVELDTALIDLKKTTSMSDNELAQFYRDANTEAKNLGVTTKEIIEQAAAWSRLGYSSANEATTMARLSSQFAMISPGMSTEEAQESLVSVMKAFRNQFPEVDDVLDGIMSKINIVGNSFALSNKDIADALMVSSSAMQAANNTFEETVALITAGTEITQDPSRVGNGLRTISMRIRGLNEETGEFDETLGNVQNDISELTHGMVSIMDDPNTYKSTYEILKRISEIWDQLSDKEQAGLLEKLFGKTRAQIGAAILANFESAEKAIERMEESAGSADKEMGIIMDSLDYKLNRLKETGVGIWQDIINRESFGKFIDGMTKVAEVVGIVIEKFGLLKTILGAGALVLAIKNIGVFKDLIIGVIAVGSKADKFVTFLYSIPKALAAIAASPITGVVAVVAAIAAAIKLYKEMNPTVQEAIHRADEYKSKLDQLQSEYDKNAERLKELNELKTNGEATLQNDVEISQLETQNALLEAQIQLYEDKYRAANKAATETARSRAKEILDENNDPGIYGLNDIVANYQHAKAMLARNDLSKYQRNAYTKQIETYGKELQSQFDDITAIIKQLDPIEDAELINQLTSLAKSVSVELSIEYDPNGKTKKSLAQFKKDIANLKQDTKDAIQKMFDLGIDKLTEDELKKVQSFVKGCGYSIDELVEYFSELYNISETSIESSTSRSIGNLTSFRDELLKTKVALEEYKAMMEGGEKGDSIAAMQEIYKGAMEDLKSGKIDSNRLRAAAQLFFSPEQLAEMNFDMEEIGRKLQSSMFEGLFDPTGESKNTAGQRMIKYIKDNADAFKGVAQVTEDGSGKINFFYSSLKELADAFGVSEAAMGAFLDEWDAYGVNVMRSTEENRKLIADYEDMVKEAGNAKEAVKQLASQMHTEGSDMLEIGSLMKDLQNAGVIKLSDKELNDTLESVFKSLSDIDDANPEATAHLNGNPAINDANQLRRTLEAILTPPITTNVILGANFALSGSGASVGKVTGTSTTGLNTKRVSRASGGTVGRDGEVLVNELGPELISDEGQAFIANGGEPGFVHLSKDAIVFNADDTAQIFKYGFRDIEYPGYSEGTRKGLRDRLLSGSRVGAAASLSSILKSTSTANAKNYVQSQKSTTSTTSKPVGTAANYNSGNTNTSRLTNTTSTTVSYWTCPRCGTKTSTYMRKCDKCGYDRYSNSSSVPKTQQTQVQTQKSLSTIGRYTGSYIANQSGNFNELYSYENAASAAGGGGGGGGGGYESQSQTNPQKIDWIAVLLNRLERSIQDLEKIASSAFNKLDKRLGAAKQEVSKLNEEIDAQNRGYQRYIQEANSIGLRSDLAEKVKNGTIDINEYDDEELKQQIQEYQEWFFMMPPYTAMYTKNCF